MKPLSLKLRGAIGVYDGLGLDEIDLDFSKFEPGLIAIVGGNGSGKTTILENCHAYPQLASRDGALANHFRLRDSCRDFSFAMSGHVYRSNILIDAHTGKTEGYLYRDGQPLTDGKISTYKAEVERLLGSPDLFFRSVFSAQNAESITNLTTGKRKELFLELLGLQRYDLYAEYAKQHADEVSQEIDRRRGKIEQIDQDIVGVEGLEAGIAECDRLLAGQRDEIKSKERLIEMVRKELSTLSTEQAAAEEKRKQVLLLTEEIQAGEQRAKESKSRLTAKLNDLQRKRDDVEAEIKRKEQILEHREEIGRNVERLAVLQSHDEGMVRRYEQYQKVSHRMYEATQAYQVEASKWNESLSTAEHARDKELSRWEAEENSFSSKGDTLDDQLTKARETAKLIGEVPCRTVPGLPDQCQLLSAANNARNSIPELERQIDALNKEFSAKKEAAKKEIQRLQNAVDEIRKTQPAPFDPTPFATEMEDIGYVAEQHNEIRAEIQQIKKHDWQALKSECTAASEVIEQKRQQLQEFAANHMEAIRLHDEEEVRIAAELSAKKDRRAQLQTVLNLVLELDRKVGMIKAHLEEYDAALVEAREDESTLVQRLGGLRGQIERVKSLAVEKENLQREIECYARKAEHWRLLHRACSKDGIPALELDAAGPEVSRIANDLLSSTFGSRFQISFETTKISKDKKKQIETFDIRVYGEEGEKRIEDLSGGQRVWIEKAIQEAIAIYLSEKSGKEYLTSYADEADGPLDPDNKQHFLDMLRESFRLGRRHLTFLITQTPEIWGQVQQRIHLNPATASVGCVY